MSLTRSTLAKPRRLPRPTVRQTTFTRQSEPGLCLASAEHDGWSEHHLTLLPRPEETTHHLAERLAATLRDLHAEVVRCEGFGDCAAGESFRKAMHSGPSRPHWPLTWIEGADCVDRPVAGVHVLAVAGCPVETVWLGDQAVGRMFAEPPARHCLLAGLASRPARGGRVEQTRRAYQNLLAALAAAGLHLGHVVRTWFFLEDILAWYDEFNAVRNDFYQSHAGRFPLVPASTGIAGRNPAGTALELVAWAVQPQTAACEIREVPSPLQCAAPNYGSLFSRAVELASPAVRRLLISGTASIGPDGRTMHTGDLVGQIERTMEVVHALLATRGMDWAHVTRATAYVHETGDGAVWAHWCRTHGLQALPVLTTVCEVCRPDLWFELEVDAMALCSPASSGKESPPADQPRPGRVH